MNEIIEQERGYFEQEFKKFLLPKVDEYIQKYVFAKSKRIRPLMGILFSKALGFNLTKEHYSLLFAVELIHNASLSHDDVIDEAAERRGEKSLNKKFDNSLAVLSGDLLLAYGLKNILDVKNLEVQNLCAQNMVEICEGEAKQYFLKFNIPDLQEYIDKSYKKTGKLFETVFCGLVLLSNKREYYDLAKILSKKIGLAFQIKNDLQNYIEQKEDYSQGIYTAPVIFGEKNGIEKTKNLINNYLDEALNLFENIEKNDYLEALAELINEIRV